MWIITETVVALLLHHYWPVILQEKLENIRNTCQFMSVYYTITDEP